MSRVSQLTEDFFCAAVSACAQKEDYNAWAAAFVAAIRADNATRKKFAIYVMWAAGAETKQQLVDDLSKLGRAIWLSDEREQTIEHEQSAERKLKAADYDYWVAWTRRNATVFHRRYPDLAVPGMAEVTEEQLSTRALFDDPKFRNGLAIRLPDTYKRLVAEGLVMPLSSLRCVSCGAELHLAARVCSQCGLHFPSECE